MNESGSTWSTPRELLSVALAPPQLKRTVSVMLIVGSTFFAMLPRHVTATSADITKPVMASAR